MTKKNDKVVKSEASDVVETPTTAPTTAPIVNEVRNTEGLTVGKRALLDMKGTKGVSVEVLVKEVKHSYGRDRFLVTPVAGRGEIWTERVRTLE